MQNYLAQLFAMADHLAAHPEPAPAPRPCFVESDGTLFAYEGMSPETCLRLAGEITGQPASELTQEDFDARVATVTAERQGRENNV